MGRGVMFSMGSRMRSLFLFLLTGFLSIGLAAVGRTHGGRIEQKVAEAIVLETVEDSGAPMSGAIVAIYTPGDSVTPWKTGTTDAQGQFMFIPDRTQPGEWTAQVRLAGHGHRVSITIPAEATSTPVPVHETIAPSLTIAPPVSSQTPASQPISPEVSHVVLPNTPLQQGLLVGSVLWGFVGTGLFFFRRDEQK